MARLAGLVMFRVVDRREEDDRDRGEPRTRAASLTIEHHRRSTTLNMTKPASRAIYAALSAALRYVSRRARLFEKLRKISEPFLKVIFGLVCLFGVDW